MFPPGKYWIGDLCYVMHEEWNEVCKLTISGQRCLEGEFALKDGRVFAMYGTMYGDGEYADNHGKRYGVDSGTLGCIAVEDLGSHVDDHRSCGHVHEFNRSFDTYCKEGKVHFGDLMIDTDPEYIEEEDYDE